MTDEDDDLKRILAAAPPPAPDTARQAAASRAALTAFDASAAAGEASAQSADSAALAEEIRGEHQGSAPAARPRVRQSGLQTLFGRLSEMVPIPSMRMTMMGGASVAVLALAVVSTQQFHDAGPGTGTMFETAATGTDDRDAAEPAAGARPAISGGAVNEAGTARERPSKPPATGGDRAVATPLPVIVPKTERPAVEAEEAAPAGAGQGALSDLAPRAPAPEAQIQRKIAPELRSLGQAESAGGIAGGVAGQFSVAPAPTMPEQIIVQPPVDRIDPAYREQGRDRFSEIDPNQIRVTAEEPVSTFSIDVDTSSYAFLRGMLMRGVLPQKDAVRIEELINYFPYDYPSPESRDEPFRANVAIMPTPWNEGTKLMRIGIQGYDLDPAEKPRSNLVFLIDTSGSMQAENKLPLLLNSFRLLVEQLAPEDTVSIVAYAGSAGTVLEPTPVAERAKILASLDRLRSGGSTAGGEGIRQAYRLAEANFDPEGVNRVILATDGDFNVGIRDTEELTSFIERKRDTGVFLSVLGFGQGNYNDTLMQALAQNGNGTAAYIDTLSEARKVMVDEASSTLFPIAKDVKIQVEFNPATVQEYRLIGYETRLLNREDFNNDRIDAGEIGSGHSVTALYEITPVGSAATQVDALRYGTAESVAPRAAASDETSDELAFVKIRYKAPEGSVSKLITRAVTPLDEADRPDTELRFAAAVAGFGQLLRGGRHTGGFDYDDVVALASDAKGDDAFGYRAEFVNLVRLAKGAAALEPQRQ